MLKAKIEADIYQALKNRDQKRLMVLRSIMAEVKNLEIDKKSELDDEEIIKILRKQVKVLREARETFIKGGREDLGQQNDLEIKILQEYLPKELPVEELREKIKNILAKEGVDNSGRLIGICVKELGGVAEPKKIAEIVKELTS